MPTSENADKNFDAEAFYAAVAATVAARDVTWKQVSQETGISTTTLTRMSQGRRPDAASLAALSAWAVINPADFVRLERSGDSRRPETLAQITTLLRRDRRLKPDAAKALEVIIHSAYGQLRSAAPGPAASDPAQRKKNKER
jgi:transcriptional regulator with XRE-family HTH domain